MSREERKFVERVENSIQLKEGHFKMKLPFKKENVTMPNNMCVSKQRICGLRKIPEGCKFSQSIRTSSPMSLVKAMPNKCHNISLYHRKERYGIYLTMECTIQGKVRYELYLSVQQNSKASLSTANFSRAQI